GHLAVEVFQRDGLAFAEGHASGSIPANVDDLASPGDVVDDAEFLAGGGHLVEPGDFDGHRWAGLLDRAALVVEHGADPAEAIAAADRVADLERTILDEGGRHDTPTFGDRRFQAGPGRRSIGIGAEVALQ